MQPIELAVASPRSAARQTVRGARARQDWPELLSQATRIQRETPNEPDGYVLAAIALRRLQRRPTLRSLLADALQRFPAHPQLLAPQSGNVLPKSIQSTTPDELEALPASIRAAVEQADWPAVVQLFARLRCCAAAWKA
jgi:hypothetical protein